MVLITYWRVSCEEFPSACFIQDASCVATRGRGCQAVRSNLRRDATRDACGVKEASSPGNSRRPLINTWVGKMRYVEIRTALQLNPSLCDRTNASRSVASFIRPACARTGRSFACRDARQSSVKRPLCDVLLRIEVIVPGLFVQLQRFSSF